jgi:hypothetical protein
MKQNFCSLLRRKSETTQRSCPTGQGETYQWPGEVSWSYPGCYADLERTCDTKGLTQITFHFGSVTGALARPGGLKLKIMHWLYAGTVRPVLVCAVTTQRPRAGLTTVSGEYGCLQKLACVSLGLREQLYGCFWGNACSPPPPHPSDGPINATRLSFQVGQKKIIAG